MNKVVLDASALLALLNQEPGYEVVEKHLPNVVISSVNLSEVITVLIDLGMPDKEAESLTSALVKEIIPFDYEQAFIAAAFRKITKVHGLSFADRACLALAEVEDLAVLTADKAWNKLKTRMRIYMIR